MTERTIRDLQDEPTSSGREAPDVLYVALCGERPTAGGIAVALAPGEILVLGRGTDLAVEPRSAEGEVWLRLPDGRVSERHAVVDRRGEAITVEDLGSTNGTLVGGQPVRTAELADGQPFAVGRSILFIRRRAGGAVLGGPLHVPGAPELATLSPEAARAHGLLARAAPSDVPVLLRGETGTGKEVAARALHALSGRAGRLVALNCGAVPEALIESELFGVRRGAFSGAQQDRPGLIAAAAKGTLFLDEIAELTPAAQVKLLRVLQDRRVTPLGATSPEAAEIDFRLVSATHQDLSARAQSGQFRSDLYGRVRGLDLELPPLRERRMDLGLLVAALLRRHAPRDAEAFRFDRAAAEALFAHDFPLNVRELDRVLQALIALAGPDRLFRRESLDEAGLMQPARARPPVDPDAVRAELLAQLGRHQGNITAVARAMRRTRMQVHRWLKRWQIDPQTFRP